MALHTVFDPATAADHRRSATAHIRAARAELMAALRELDGVCSRAHEATGNAVGLLDDAKVSIASTELDERMGVR